MREWLMLATEYAILVIDAMALVVIAVATIEAFVGGMRLMLAGRASGHERHQVWLRYARALVAALTFQLAADILESAVAPDWESLGRLGAIAVIRTFLSYFLDKDMADIREREIAAVERERKER